MLPLPMAPRAPSRNTLKAPYTLVDQHLDERLIRDAAPFGHLPRATEKVIRYAQGDLGGAPVQRLQHLALELLVTQSVEWVGEWRSTCLVPHPCVNLLMIRLDAALAWIGYRPSGWSIQITTNHLPVLVVPTT